MPQLVKGGKWVFGWVVVGNQQQITIPPDAFAEYGFQPGETVLFLHGSLRSGGFSVGKLEKLKKSKVPIQQHAFAQGKIKPDGQVELPTEAGTQPGDRLLVVRGSAIDQNTLTNRKVRYIVKPV